MIISSCNYSIEVDSMRVIQVGGGFWGSGWARVIAEFPETELVGVVDVSEAALDRTCDPLGLPQDKRFIALGDALVRVPADAALVVVPPEAHAAVAIECLEAGLDVLVEKPLAPTVDEAAQIVHRADELARTIMVTQSFRFKRGPQTVRKLIAEGAVGAIEAVDVRFAKAPQFGGFREEMDEPLIVDMAIHHFDFMRGILGLEPSRVRARSFNPSWSWFRGNAAAFVQFETADGAHINYSGSWVSRNRETTWDGSWEIQGTEGSIVWEHNRVEFRPSPENEIALTVYRRDMLERGDGVMDVPLIELAAEERAGTLLEFVTAQREGRTPQASGRDNLRSLGLVYGAVESAGLGGDWVDLTEEAVLA
jgi:predicted dehydrogenase